MEIDWSKVKNKTLWHYDELLAKLHDALEYRFIQRYYNHSMEKAASFADLIKSGYRQTEKIDLFNAVAAYFNTISAFNVQNYHDYILQIDSKSKCEMFLLRTGVDFDDLVQSLYYLYRWVLPKKCYLKELIETSVENHHASLERLNEQGIKSNLDLLERGATPSGRAEIAAETGMGESLLLDWVHRADMSRLAFVAGKTVKHLCRGGYDSLQKIASADLEKMQADMTAYYMSIGKSYADFQAVIPLNYIIGGAQILPQVVEE